MNSSETKEKKPKRKQKLEMETGIEKKPKKKKGPDVQISTVKFLDVGGNDVTLVVGILLNLTKRYI